MGGRMKKPVCLLIGIGFLAWCGGREPRVDKIIEDGTEVVLNHLEPYEIKGEPWHLTLEEETRIDFEKNEYSDLGLKEPDIVEADSRGNIFVVEKFPDSEYFIYKFSPDGRFIMKFGRKGQGPGEVQGIWDLLLDKNDRILVSDPSVNKVVEFDTEGRFINETKVGPGLREVLPLANGNYLARRSRKSDSDPTGMSLCLFSPGFEELKTVGFYDMSDLVPGKRQSGIIIPFYWRVSGDRIYVGNGRREYDIRVYDLEGKLLGKIRKDFHPVAYPEDFRLQTERIAAAQPSLNLFVLKDMPPFNSFFVDEAGRLFVMTYERNENGEGFVHDVFNRDGILMARVPLGNYGILGRALNHLRATATNGRFYRLWFKESGYPELIVYRMVWE
jgi:6-bladed beta-propeller